MGAKFPRKMQNSITIDTKRPAVGADNLCPCFAIVMIVTLRLIQKKNYEKWRLGNERYGRYFTLFTAPRAHCVDERRSTCSSCSRQRAANVNHTDGVCKQSRELRRSSSNLVSARTASAMPAFVTADHTSDKFPYSHKRNLSEFNLISDCSLIIPMPYL